jgi:serine protease Do
MLHAWFLWIAILVLAYMVFAVSSGRRPEPRPWLGVSGQDLTETVRQEQGLPPHIYGLLLDAVRPGSPAGAAGLQPGDVIQEIEYRIVSSLESLASELGRQSVGRTVQVTIWRNGNVLDLPVLLTAP